MEKNMNDKVKRLEEEWDKEVKTEDQLLDESFFGMELLIYNSRSLKYEEGSNVKVTEIPDKKKK